MSSKLFGINRLKLKVEAMNFLPSKVKKIKHEAYDAHHARVVLECMAAYDPGGEDTNDTGDGHIEKDLGGIGDKIVQEQLPLLHVDFIRHDHYIDQRIETNDYLNNNSYLQQEEKS